MQDKVNPMGHDVSPADKQKPEQRETAVAQAAAAMLNGLENYLSNLGHDVAKIDPKARETVLLNFKGAVNIILDASKVK